MTNEEAKFILRAYRPSGRDAHDPTMAAALQQAQLDPQLRAWFEREQQHAALMAEKLRSITPPPSLRDAIMAGARAGRTSERRGLRRVRWWQIGLAAAFACLIGAGLWWRFAPVPGATLDEFAVNFVARKFLLQSRQHDVAALKDWLVTHGGPRPGPLPPTFERLRALGCRTVTFDGREVSLLCFTSAGNEFHVFVARRDQLEPVRLAHTVGVREQRQHAVASWSDASNYYVLVSDAPVAVVERLL